MSEQRKSAGLLLMTKVPDLGLCAVLQRRGEWDFEKNKYESWPGGCQITVHGKLEEGELFATGLWREVKEELGIWLFGKLNDDCIELQQSIVDYLVIYEDYKVITFMLFVNYDLLKLIRLHPSSGGLRFLPQSHVDSIKPMQEFAKNIFITEAAMFSDEIKAVRKAFELCTY